MTFFNSAIGGASYAAGIRFSRALMAAGFVNWRTCFLRRFRCGRFGGMVLHEVSFFRDPQCKSYVRLNGIKAGSVEAWGQLASFAEANDLTEIF